MRRLGKKLTSRRGMTLTEVLAALAILALVGTGIVAGVSASLRVYRQSVLLSDAQTLSSTLSIALMDELRYAREAETGTDPSFTSALHGAGVTLGTEEGRLVICTSSGKERALVGEGTYAGLVAELTAFSYRPEDGFQVELQILDGTEPIQTVAFSVCPLNE